MKNNKLPLWRRVLIGLLFVSEFIAILTLINIDNIIDYKLESVPADIYEYVDNNFGYRTLSEEKQKAFEERNCDKLGKYHNSDDYERAAEILYMNQLYINTYGKKAFDESIDSVPYYADEEISYNKREARLRNRAYTYLYPKWKYEYSKYINLSEKENQERKSSTYILYSILLFCGMCVYLLSYRKIGYSNGQIHGLIVYNIICEILSLIIASLALILDQDTINNSYGLWALLFFPSVVICPIMISFLSKRTEENFQSQVLIPKYFTRTDIVNSELSKRIFLALISYPLFYIVPIPYGGIFVFIFYIIPMAIVFAIVNILLWIAKGRKIDKNFQTSKSENSTARIYCRFCGKLIDADSAYCRYCGKKQ